MEKRCYQCDSIVYDPRANFCSRCAQPIYSEEVQAKIKFVQETTEMLLKGFCISCRLNELIDTGETRDNASITVMNEILSRLNVERELFVYRSIMDNTFDWVVICKLKPNQKVHFDWEAKKVTLNDGSELHPLSFRKDGDWHTETKSLIEKYSTGYVNVTEFDSQLAQYTDWNRNWENIHKRIFKLYNGYETHVTLNQMFRLA